MSRDGEIDRKRVRVEFLQRSLYILIAFLLTGILITIVIDLQIGREQRSVLVDCTTPSGECYQRGQEQTGKVVETLANQDRIREQQTRLVVILATYCIQEIDHVTLDRLQACVENELHKRGGSE